MGDLSFRQFTPIQDEAFTAILSGKNVVGIAQTGTGKTLAYMLPLLKELKYSDQIAPRILILVPTRELVLQLVEQINEYAKYMSVRVLGVYGGTNINTQELNVAEGCDIIIGTPGRLYDLVVCKSLSLKSVKKLVIDEVDIMLDLGFRFQLTNIFDLLPKKRQNLMFSATMTEAVDVLIDDHFIEPIKISIAVSGTPLENIEQTCYLVHNFNTKINLLKYLVRDQSIFEKVIVFVASKKKTDRLFDAMFEDHAGEISLVHGNKSQNFRIRSIEDFNDGKRRILITTDLMARGLDLNQISHVISFDVPIYPENYIHRIGRTGRAEKKGKAILFYTEKEEENKLAIEVLMNYEIPEQKFPENVVVNRELIPEERNKNRKNKNPNRNAKKSRSGPGEHEKKAKNKKVNLGGSYKRKMSKKYKKPKTRGDKNIDRRNKK